VGNSSVRYIVICMNTIARNAITELALQQRFSARVAVTGVSHPPLGEGEDAGEPDPKELLFRITCL